MLRDEAQLLEWKTAARKVGYATAGEWARTIVENEVAGREKAAEELGRWKERALRAEREARLSMERVKVLSRLHSDVLGDAGS